MPSEKPYIEWPGLLGGMNWGGISIDENTGMMFVNDTMALMLPKGGVLHGTDYIIPYALPDSIIQK